jgi:hypothetical protein
MVEGQKIFDDLLPFDNRSVGVWQLHGGFRIKDPQDVAESTENQVIM